MVYQSRSKESARGTVQLVEYAAMEDATRTNWREESAFGTGQMIKDAPMEDATTIQRKKECVWGMGQLWKGTGAEVRNGAND